MALALLIAALVPFILIPVARAQELTKRSLRLTTSVPSATSGHTFNFDILSGGSLGSIMFEYCENSPLFDQPCVTPMGLSFASATLSNQSGETGFTIHGNSTSTTVILTRIPVIAVPQTVSYAFSGVVNPSAQNKSVYVRISTYASDDGTGSVIDRGSVVFSTSGGLGFGLFVPPYLTFCVGITVAGDCSVATGNSLNVGEMSPQLTSAASSQFSAATNDVSGYNVFINGTTMISGTNVIPATAVPTSSSPGTSRFGVNVRANTSPSVGQDRTGVGTANGTANYSAPNQFMFVSGDLIATTPATSDFNVFTVSYVVDVSSSQAPGVYASTFTYIATAAF